MPLLFRRHNVKNVFNTDEKHLSSQNIDLPTKLTLLFKRGFGRRYISKPINDDAPITPQHKEVIKSQHKQSSYDHYVRTMTVASDRKKAFDDYKIMDYSPEISSALDIYADESLTLNEYGDILTINSDNARVKKVLENLFGDVIDINHQLWNWLRNMCKYGDWFVLLDVQPEKGVVGFLPLPVAEIRREEGFDDDPNNVKFIWDTNGLEFDNWQVAHFRLLSDEERMPYGTSAIEAARLSWKQLKLAEDAMLIYRITRAPERRVFYIDVGNIDPKDVDAYMETIKQEIKRTPAIDIATGNMDIKYLAMSVEEDLFIPRRHDKTAEIDTLPGASNLDEIGDIEYIQQKLYSALKIPKAYFSDEADIKSKATLASQDFRFARTINRFQQALLSTMNQIAIIHLYALGMRDKEQLLDFELSLTNPSSQSELEKLELLNQRASVFDALWDDSTLSPASYVWAMQEIFGFADEQIKVMIRQQMLEGKMKLEIENASIDPELEQAKAGFKDIADFEDAQEKKLEPIKKLAPEKKEKPAQVSDNIEKLFATMNILSEDKKTKPKKEVFKHNSFIVGGIFNMLSKFDDAVNNKRSIVEVYQEQLAKKGKS